MAPETTRNPVPHPGARGSVVRIQILWLSRVDIRNDSMLVLIVLSQNIANHEKFEKSFTTTTS